MEAELIERNIYRSGVETLKLAKYIAENYCEFDEKELNMMDIFWDAAFNKSWLYASNEMVENMFGYKAGKNMMSDFGEKLKNEFEEDVDYQIVTKNNEIIQKFYSGNFRNRKIPGNRAKYYIITGETFKSILQSTNT